MPVVRKSDFAKLRNVSQGRVTQWITAGQISGAAIIGEGRSARIDSELALAQLQERLSINERFGLNGLNTKLDDDVEPPHNAVKGPQEQSSTGPSDVSAPGESLPRAPARVIPDDESAGPIDARIKAEKLKQNEILTRKQELEEKTRYGAYVLASDVTGELNRLTAEMVRIFEGCLPDIASAAAAKFQISQREVLHLLRAEFERAREQLVTAGEAAAAESE